MKSDGELLTCYVNGQSEDAFAELVRRHIDLVYSAALRQVNGDVHLAHDVAQTVFTDLARKAASLSRRPTLTGWLYTSTHFAAAKAVRGERRRRAREQEAMSMREWLHESRADLEWEKVRPVLDAAMLDLKGADRDAILLRFFENRPLTDVGEKLGLSEDAVRKRVDRAVDRLRTILAHRGIATAAAALGSVLSTHAVQVAPAGMAMTLTGASLAAAGTGSTLAALSWMTMTTLQKSVIATTIIAAIGVGVYEAHQTTQLRGQVRVLKRQQAPLTNQIQRLQGERDEFAGQLAALRDHNDGRTIGELGELPKLRAEVTRLQSQLQQRRESKAADSLQTEMDAWLARVDEVKQRFEQTPGAKIPELQFLTQLDWLDATKDNSLKDDKDFRDAMAALRRQAVLRYAMVAVGALSRYFEANSKQYPREISQLAQYFRRSEEAAILLERYQMIPGIYLDADTAKAGIGDWAITQKEPLDEKEDVRLVIAGVGTIFTNYRLETDHALDSAISAFAAANDGRMPKQIWDLKPFISTREEQEAFRWRTTFDYGHRSPSTVPGVNPPLPTRDQ